MAWLLAGANYYADRGFKHVLDRAREAKLGEGWYFKTDSQLEEDRRVWKEELKQLLEKRRTDLRLSEKRKRQDEAVIKYLKTSHVNTKRAFAVGRNTFENQKKNDLVILTMPVKRVKGSKRLDKAIKKYFKSHKKRTGGALVSASPYSSLLQEMKLVDNATTALTLVNVPTIANSQVVLLNSIAQGTDYTTRIGRLARMTSVQIAMKIWIAPGSNSANNFVGIRAMLYCDRQPNGAEPTVIGDVLTTVTGASSSHMEFKNLTNRDRFVIIKNRHWNFYPWNTGAVMDEGISGTKGFVTWDFYKKLKIDKTVYSGTSAGITNISTCALYIAVWATVDNIVQSQTRYRVRFVDS